MIKKDINNIKEIFKDIKINQEMVDWNKVVTFWENIQEEFISKTDQINQYNITSNSIDFMVGNGFTMSIYKKFSSWDQINTKVHKELSIAKKDNPNLGFAMQAMFIDPDNKREFISFVNENAIDSNINEENWDLYKEMFGAALKAFNNQMNIITTNFDNSIERMTNFNKHFDGKVKISNKNIIKLHSSKNGSVILSQDDYIKMIDDKRRHWGPLKRKVSFFKNRETTLLIMGYSFQDFHIQALLKNISENEETVNIVYLEPVLGERNFTTIKEVFRKNFPKIHWLNINFLNNEFKKVDKDFYRINTIITTKLLTHFFHETSSRYDGVLEYAGNDYQDATNPKKQIELMHQIHENCLRSGKKGIKIIFLLKHALNQDVMEEALKMLGWKFEGFISFSLFSKERKKWISNLFNKYPSKITLNQDDLWMCDIFKENKVTNPILGNKIIRNYLNGIKISFDTGNDIISIIDNFDFDFNELDIKIISNTYIETEGLISSVEYKWETLKKMKNLGIYSDKNIRKIDFMDENIKMLFKYLFWPEKSKKEFTKKIQTNTNDIELYSYGRIHRILQLNNDESPFGVIVERNSQLLESNFKYALTGMGLMEDMEFVTTISSKTSMWSGNLGINRQPKDFNEFKDILMKRGEYANKTSDYLIRSVIDSAHSEWLKNPEIIACISKLDQRYATSLRSKIASTLDINSFSREELIFWNQSLGKELYKKLNSTQKMLNILKQYPNIEGVKENILDIAWEYRSQSLLFHGSEIGGIGEFLLVEKLKGIRTNNANILRLREKYNKYLAWWKKDEKKIIVKSENELQCLIHWGSSIKYKDININYEYFIKDCKEKDSWFQMDYAIRIAYEKKELFHLHQLLEKFLPFNKNANNWNRDRGENYSRQVLKLFFLQLDPTNIKKTTFVIKNFSVLINLYYDHHDENSKKGAALIKWLIKNIGNKSVLSEEEFRYQINEINWFRSRNGQDPTFTKEIIDLIIKLATIHIFNPDDFYGVNDLAWNHYSKTSPNIREWFEIYKEDYYKNNVLK